MTTRRNGENVTANSTASEKDTDSLAGWSIQNQRFQRTSRSGSWSSSASQLQIRISGYENTFTNSAPIFDDGSDTSREFNETIGDATVATATNVGTAVSATDTDTTDTLEYSLGGTDAGKFGIVETTGQIQTKVGEKYSYETDTSYAVTVTVGDGNGGSDSIDVTLDVADQSEPPLLPEAPDVTGHNDVTKLLVTLTRPDNADRPNISGYQLRIRRPGISWSELEWKSHLDRTIAGANSGTRFEVQYRARNDEGEGPWSPSGFGSTRAHATGAPDITGTAEVGQSLTAGTSGISDGNGKSKAENGDVGFAYTYQWVRRVSGTDSDISGATSSTYTLTAADEGNKVKVKASFTDNAGYEEGPLTSSAYPSSGTVLEQIPTVTITADKTSAVFKEEGITYTLTRTAPTIDALDVTVTLTQDKDFLATADLGKTVTIAAGQSTKTFRVAASGFQQFAAGTPVEGGTLTAEVQDGADYDVETPASVEVAIVIGVMVRLDMASYSVGEAAGTVSIKLIARTGPGAPQPSSATSVIERVTEDGTAIKDSDFMFTNSGVEFETAGFSADGSVWKAQKTFAVSITDDEDDEDDETFNVTIRHGPGTVSVSLVDAMGNSCGNECTAAITIIDNDTPLPALSFSNIVTVDEDDGPAEQRVGLTPASSETVTVDFATRDRVGGATAGEDYTATSGTLTFTPGQTSKTITIPILDDDVYEKDIELLVVDLSNPTGATLPHPPSRSVDIHSEDAVPTASMADVTVDEGAGTMTLSLRLSHPSDEDIGYFTSFEADNDEGTATAGEDYDDFRMEPGVGRTAIITVPARNLSQTFDITLVDDGLEEPDETIKILWYKNVTSEVTPASLDFIGTIEDNDEGAGAAMGKPKIAGRAEVGQTLTVSTSAITDQHGNTKAENGEAGYAYTYQWYRLDAGAETPIAGARGRGNTYTLVQADEGKQFAVEVRFTDDVGNSEGPLKSNEYPPNAANGELRLEDGPTENVGRLEVFHNGEWGTVCDDQFDERVDDPGTLHDRRRFPNIAPRKACQFMGYANGQMIPRGNMSVAPASKKIWLDDVRCLAGSNHWTGAPPEKLHHCYHAGWSNNNGSISESYASPCYGGGEAGPVVGAGGEADEVEPAQVVVQIAGGDAAAGTQEVLQPTVAAVHRLHMQIAPNPFPHRAVECFVAHPERGGARWVTRAAVGDQQGVLRDHRIEGSRERRRIDPGQHRADRRPAPVCRHENRHLLAREAALLRLAAPPPCLASQPARALPALQDVGLVRFHDPLEHLRIAPRRRQKPVTPAERRAHRHVAARRRGLHRLPLRQRRPERQPAFLVVQARQRRTAQRVEGPAAALALVAPQTPRHTARNRPFARAMRTAPGLVHTKLDRGLRCLALAPARQHRERLAPLRARQPARRRKPRLETPDVHDPTPCRSTHSTTNAYNSRIEP